MSIQSIMRKFLLFICFFLVQGYLWAQFTESFTDGDFTSNPTWTGDAGLFKVNSLFQLQLNGTTDATAALAVPITIVPEMEWSCWVKLSFAPSDNNLARIYLFSDQQDLKGSLNGYYIKLGETGSNDAIELVRQTGTASVVVCRGTNAFVAASFAIKVKVVRTSGGNWSVYADQAGGINYTLQATGTDNTFASGSYSGVSCKYTSSNSTKFYFDDFYAGPIIVDNTPPEIVSVSLQTPNKIAVAFSEPVGITSATNINNYIANPGSVIPESVTSEPSDASIVYLSFVQAFQPDILNTLNIGNVKDPAGNTMVPAQFPFSWHKAKTYDVLINEIMADPTPPVNLPEAEYVELYNRSAYPLDLKDWVLMLGSSRKIFPQATIPAFGYAILSTTASKVLFTPFGQVIDFSSFAVTNLNGTITLKDNYGNVIHTVTYTESWFQGSSKKDGGWSLEQVDPLNPCGEAANWKVSTDENGGTPGKMNSVNASDPDLIPPTISHVDVIDKTHISVRFSESCDSTNLYKTANYTIDNGFGHPVAVSALGPDFKVANLVLSSELAVNFTYTLTCTSSIIDCAGNPLLTSSSAQFVLYVDVTPPNVVSASVEAVTQVTVIFNEAVDPVSAIIINNYVVSPGSLSPVSATKDQSNPAIVHLVFSQAFASDQIYSLNVSNVADIAGNAMISSETSFSWHLAKSFDILINEIMADPTPPVNLPEAEYVELYNRSTFAIDLKNWSITLGTTKKVIPQFVLAAGGYVILTNTGSKLLLASYGPLIDFSSFAITNGSGSITLKDNNGRIIHEVSYDESWFQGSYKKDGGWSLEMVDPMNPCGEASNWKACSNETGGTPGTINSVNASNPDHIPPAISRVGVDDPTHITVWFTETVDSTNIQNPANYTIDNGIGNPSAVFTHSPDFKYSKLALSSPLITGVVYTLTSTNSIMDCAGNPLLTGTSARFAIPLTVAANDLVINELLYDPPTGCVDFVEVFNRSTKVLDMKDLVLSNYDTISHVITDYNEISKEPFLILPGEYFVLSTDSTSIKKHYKTTNPKAFINMPGFPSMNNDEGVVAISTKSGQVIDVAAYNTSMQYPLLTSLDGVSLERINPERPSKDITNWHSASEAVGYATPGYQNSQFGSTLTDENEITLSPDIFSPDNDGYNDNLTIAYSFGTPGNNATVTIYDTKGRLIRSLVNHELCGTSGVFSWDGITNDRTKALIGRYIVFIEIFDLDGRVKHFKKSTVLGGKL